MTGGRRGLRAPHLVLASLFLAAGPALPPPAAAAASQIIGKVALQGNGVAGARVFAFRSFEDMVAFRPAAAATPTDSEGRYYAELPPGSYYFTARRHDGRHDAPVPEGGLFAYHGSNPFTLAAGSRTVLNFPLAPKIGETRRAAGDDPTAGSLSGVVLFDGKPLPGARVKLYLDAAENFRGMAYAVSPPADGGGAFRFDFLPESSYFVVAHKRSGGSGAGPLGEGDYYGYYVDNPVDLQNGTETIISLSMVSKGAESVNADGRPRPSGTVIAGRITDAEGRVIPAAYAFAYREKLMSHKKPAFLSPTVDGEGRYVLHLATGGTYYIGARSRYGDSPARGEWYGRYDGSADHAVAVETGGRLEGVDIVVERINP